MTIAESQHHIVFTMGISHIAEGLFISAIGFGTYYYFTTPRMKLELVRSDNKNDQIVLTIKPNDTSHYSFMHANLDCLQKRGYSVKEVPIGGLHRSFIRRTEQFDELIQDDRAFFDACKECDVSTIVKYNKSSIASFDTYGYKNLKWVDAKRLA
jgi:hypothetical protein